MAQRRTAERCLMTKPPPIPFPNVVGNVEKFMEERQAVLAKGDALEVARFLKKYNPQFDNSDLKEEVAEIVMHKARIGLKSLTKEERKASRQWLRDRGHESLI